MKKYIIYSLIISLTCGLGACNNDEGVDKANPSVQDCIEISHGR